METIKIIRERFIDKQLNGDVSENGTFEILNAQFVADEKTIFGTLNADYAERELDWYKSQSLSVNNIPGKVPKIWMDIAGYSGEINSNYGWCVWSNENFNQFNSCIETLKSDKHSRRACMIYNRPSMQKDYSQNSMNDFICTYSTQLFIRDNRLHYTVYMRSNDAVFGYKNDKYWHDYLHIECLNELREHYPDLMLGDMVWNAASLHVYPRHFNLIEEKINGKIK